MEDRGNHGPKFLALPNQRMRNFVLHLLEQGSRNYSRAYIAAGYKSDNIASVQVCASKLAHDQRIQEAIFEEAARRIKGLVPLALKTVGDIMEDETSKERGKMALSILDRAGLHSVQEHKTTIEFIGQDPARITRLRLMAEQLGVPFEQLVGERIAGLKLPAPEPDLVTVEAEFDEAAPDEK